MCYPNLDLDIATSYPNLDIDINPDLAMWILTSRCVILTSWTSRCQPTTCEKKTSRKIHGMAHIVGFLGRKKSQPSQS